MRQDAALAILIGSSTSAVSTIFIAAPFLAVLLERAPEYKGRAARSTRRDDEAGEPPEKLVPVGAGAPIDGDGDGDGQVPAAAAPVAAAPVPAGTKQDRRRQRRRARPHGRAR